MKKIFLLMVCAIGLLTGSLASQTKSAHPPKRVLFIGNSYTAGTRATLNRMLSESSYKQTKFEYITKGGATLKRHLEDKKTIETIKTGNWDIVVLQEQSQMPALPGASGASFQNSVDALTKIIQSAGAEPVLFMTWGRCDGDKSNSSLFPDFETMQKKLSKAYRTAAKRNSITVAPIGEGWAAVRKSNSRLGNALFAPDGSHPSPKGAFLNSLILLRVLFNDPINNIKRPTDLTTQEWTILRNASLSVKLK